MNESETSRDRINLNRRLIALSLALSLVIAACSSGDDNDTTPNSSTTQSESGDDPDGSGDATTVTVDGVPVDDLPGVRPLGLRLSEGSPAAETAAALAVVDGVGLAEAQVAAILDRLPTWEVRSDDQVGFNRPADSLKPPLVGNTVSTPFPPTSEGEATTQPPPVPLEVLRFQPEGAVEIAPFLSVTFNQPMVPLGTLDQLAQRDVPAIVRPAIDGRWRWIGTRTLRFELIPGEIDRLPAATEYLVEIPVGTTSANGATLAETVSWTFSTPAPRVTSVTGLSESMSLSPVFVATFDQRVDPAAVLATVSVQAGGNEVALRLATEPEIDADDAARQAVDAALGSRTVAFVPTEPLPTDAPVAIAVGPGTPSSEGPLVSEDAATFAGRTYGALKVTGTTCNYNGTCVPGAPFTFEFSNVIDSKSFDASMVSVEPAIPAMRVNLFGASMEVVGATTGRTDYTVTLSGSLTDSFGQTLGDDQSFDFEVGPARPVLSGFDRQFITTDPAAESPSVSIVTINHDTVKVTAWKVTATDLDAFRKFYDAQWSDVRPAQPRWAKVLETEVEIAAKQDSAVETVIDLSDQFAESGGQLVVRVEPTETYDPNSEDSYSNRPTVAWVQQTALGVDVINDSDQLLIWTTDLLTGDPIPNVAIELLGDKRTVTTDADGLARIDLTDSPIAGLVARSVDSTTLVSSWGWQRQARLDEGRWYVFDDRGTYRPGETARVTGWVRRFSWADSTGLSMLDAGSEVTYRVLDPQGAEIGSGTTTLNPLGGFNFSIEIPDAANLGQAWVEIVHGTTLSTAHYFNIQDFRTPEFEVTARTDSAGPYYAADPATVAVDAEYYAGGPLPDAEVNWLVTTSKTTYSPPNWDEFTFGIWTPWWLDDRGLADIASDSVGCFDCGPGLGSAEYEQFTGRTDAGGTHYLQVDFDGPDVDLPTSISAEATVFDVNRQAWSSRTSLLVHAARYYVGLRSDRTFVEQGTPIRVDAVVTDVDGVTVAGRSVEVTAGRLEWVSANGQWSEQIADSQTCTFTSTADASDESMRCEFATDKGGTYRITAIVTDASGHRNRTELTQWVTGGEGRPTRNVQQELVTIVPDQETYAAGDTAELLVQAPFAPAHGLVTVVHGGIVSTESFDALDGSAVVRIPIDDSLVPNVTVQVDMVGSDERTADDGTPVPDAPRRPAYATAQIDLKVPPITRTLTVTATPASDAVLPGDTTAVTVEVLGPNGQPVSGADVALVVVDEAVLALSGYELADPLNAFYTQLYANVGSAYLRSTIVLDRSDLVGGNAGGNDEAAAEDSATAQAVAAAGGAPVDTYSARTSKLAGDGNATPIDVRTNFDALAVYAPDQSTDAGGTVTVEVPLPDNLTRYRVMAVAVDGPEHFGKGESTITARLPLMVRPSAPRFLNFGDTFELPVVVQNQTDEPIEVDVVIEAANLTVDPNGGGAAVGKHVTVPANDRVEVRFRASAESAGIARFRVAAVSGEMTDAAEIELPVYTPATAEAFATYGVLDDGAIAQPVLAPTDVFPQFGGLEINTSSTALQALTDAVLYLVDYEYDSADGYASRIMAVAALRDVLGAFEAEGLPDAAGLNAQVDRDIERLIALQNDDGGWNYWQRGRASIPWTSMQATHALVLADAAGYDVPHVALDAALAHLADIEQFIPAEYSEETRNTISAYALYVRNLAGDRDSGKANDLFPKLGDAQLEALAWIWPVVSDASARSEIERNFENRATDTAGAATFAGDYGEDAYLVAHSDRRTDGVILDALITETPDSDLIPKVVAGLLGGQTRGRWNNVQENAFILLAMKRYFDTFEAVTPDFVARAWLGDLYAAEHEYRGRTTDRDITVIPIADLQAAGDTDIVLAKQGAGRLYYRLGLRYAPDDLVLAARDEGFVVDRVYEPVDDPDDVTRDPDGTWHIKAGAKVRVRLTMVADAARTHVALIDPLPAGLEPVNPAFAVSQTTPPEQVDGGGGPAIFAGDYFCWCWNWFEHQNLKDDRAEAFTSYLNGGTYEYTYIARATTPGRFVVPPARAEEIYAPEVFGRSASATVVVE